MPSGAAGPLGGGWSGVYRWCRQHVSMLSPDGLNTSLARFDVIIIHLDADVAGFTYQSAGIDDGPDDLPCSYPCPPAADSVDALRAVVLRWLNRNARTLPSNWVFCIPSKCSEAWVVAAIFGASNPGGIMNQVECNLGLSLWLSQRPIKQGRLRKNEAEYKKIAGIIRERWRDYPVNLSQGNRFQTELLAAIRD